jgi:UPF0755 protein
MIKIERPGRFALFIIVVLAILFSIGTGIFKLVWGTTTIQKNGDFTIEEGAAANQVWQKLVTEGYGTRTTAWKYHARQNDATSNIQSGTYLLSRGEDITGVIERFISGDTMPDELSITYPEGFTIKQMAARTAAKNIGTEQEFINTIMPAEYITTYPFLENIPAGRDLEGYLFPDTYRVSAEDKSTDVIERMLANFARKVTPELREEAINNGRSLDQIIIMASIIEREVISDDDMAAVSGVLWKRFDENTGLAADATVRYTLDKWKAPLTYQDLQIDSPYNTRKYRGLPPGPISNPGIRAILAAIRPEISDYYYYLSAPDGQTIFSKTNDEHNVNKAKYLR